MSDTPKHIQNKSHLSHAWSNVHNCDLSEIWAFVGRTGMGKTCTMGFIADCMDVKRTQENSYGWKPRVDLKHFHWFMQPFIEDITKQDGNNKAAYPTGTVLCLDEANVENPNTEWNSVKSQALAMALQTNRNFNYIILFTTPDLKSMAIGTRRRINCIVQLLRKTNNRHGQPMAQAKIEWVTYDHKTGKPYYKYHRCWVPEKVDVDEYGKPIIIYRRKRIRRVWIPLLRKSLREPLDESKRSAQREYYGQVKKDLDYLKSYLGQKEKISKGYSMRDLQAIFRLPDGKIDFTDLFDPNNRIFDFLVEDKLIKSGLERVIVKDLERLCHWLRVEHKKSLPSRNIN